MTGNSLKLCELVVARDGAPLTRPISLQLAGGEMLAIHGSNGSGKSTLLKTIASLLPIHEGSVKVNSHWPAPSRPLYLGHLRGLTPSLSVYDNVAFWAEASGHKELTRAALHYFDLLDALQVPVRELSAGWQQRVALTRLITMPAILWLLDEPTANLDAEGVALLQSLMQSRLEQGGIILLATHMQMQGDSIRQLHLSSLANEVEVA